MSKNIKLTDQSLSSMFTIPEASWTAISKRVSLVILAKDIVSIIAEDFPNFPQLEIVCQQWKDETFQQLITQSQNINDYSKTAIQNFTELQNLIAPLDPNNPLPADIKHKAQTIIDQLAQSTATLSMAVSKLKTQVSSFTNENNIVDAKINLYKKKLGPDWQSISPETREVDKAAGLIKGAWSAINDDLNEIASGKIEITLTLLLELNIESALLSWKSLQNEADNFAVMAKGQDYYLSGQWLNEGEKNGN